MDASEESVTELQYRRARIRQDLLRNALYHSYRRRFFDSAIRWSNFATILLGASAALNFLGQFGVNSVVIGMAVAVVGALQLVFDLSGRANEHRQFQKEYYRLLAAVPEPDSFTAEDCTNLARRIAELSAEEPPTLRALDAIAYNDAIAALGDFDIATQRLRVPFLHARLAGMLSFTGANYRPVGTQQR